MKTIIQNGVKITLSDEEYSEHMKEQKKRLEEAKRKIREADLKEFKDANAELNHNITKSLLNEKSIAKKKVLQSMVRGFTTKEDFEYRKWLYNDGKLRSNWEVEEFKKEQKRQAYCNSTNFDTSSKMTNVLCFVIPFTLCFAVVMSKPDAKSLWFLYLPVAILAACFFCFISMMLGYSLNISRGKRKGLDDNDTRLENEKFKRNVGAITGAVSGISSYHHAKRSMNDFLNVDSWKELK